MIQGTYGRFGLTAAMLKRCAIFKKNNIECATLSLDFMDNIYTIKDEFISTGKASEDLTFINPYLELSDWEQESNQGLNKDEIKNKKFCLIKNGNIYYYPDGNKEESSCDRFISQKKVSISNYNNRVVFEEIYLDEVKVEDRFYSKQGLCIAIREYDKDTGKQKSFLVFDYKRTIIKDYINSYNFGVKWLKSKIDIWGSSTYLICDGPFTSKKIIEAGVTNKLIYVFHHNHMQESGIYTKRDEWNINNIKKFTTSICLTREQKEDIISLGVKANISVISNFVSTYVHDNINLNFKKNRIAFVGRLVDGKGVVDAIKVISFLNHKLNLNIYLDVFGSHPTDTPNAINRYKTIAKKENIEDKVVFHGYSSNVLEELRERLCLIFTSKSEGQGLVLLESLSAGTPVISYDCKYGPRSIITPGKNGDLVELGDIQGMALNIKDLYLNDLKRSEYARGSLVAAKELTSEEVIFSKWFNLFSSI